MLMCGLFVAGDVLVTINERNVLGYSHDQVIELFRTIQAGQQVRMRICRGYALPADATDPTAQVTPLHLLLSSLSVSFGSRRKMPTDVKC